MKAPNLPLIALIGQTASGKSELAIKLAKKFNGEVISVDSRQIYRGMDIGTGKIHGHFLVIQLRDHKSYQYLYKQIPHYGIDIANPRNSYSVAKFQKYARTIIANIHSRGKLPILCGGTGQWMDAIIYNHTFPAVKPNLALRKKLNQLATTKLFQKLQKLDPRRAATIDKHNRRRLIRALEILLTTKQLIPHLSSTLSPYSILWLGIRTDQKALYKKIDKRLLARLKAGMLKEIAQLNMPRANSTTNTKSKSKRGLSWSRLESFGLEYKFGALYLQNKLDYSTMVKLLSYAIKHYAKRQLTWWKRNKNINWIQTYPEAIKLMKSFLIESCK